MMCRAQPTLGHVGTGTCFCVEVSFSDLQLDALLVDPAPVSSLLESVPTQASCQMAPGCPTAGTWGAAAAGGNAPGWDLSRALL